ncbi:MAG TPA: ribosome maturation factor RimP [Acidimicrobiales bacterium]|nr:ribosome maturation factor RimP [Acidimicrobiales bacterium]
MSEPVQTSGWIFVEAWAGCPRFCFDQATRRAQEQGADDQEVSEEVADELFDVLAATLDRLGLELVDVELKPSLARVVVDREGGVDLDTIADATHVLSRALDEHDPFPGHRYTLEVTSPGVERPLRSQRHFSRAVGEVVSVRLVAGSQGERRVQGHLQAADDEGIVLAGEGLPNNGLRIEYLAIERARTVFSWGGAPRPSGRAGRRPKRHPERASGGAPVARSLSPGTGKSAGAESERVQTP